MSAGKRTVFIVGAVILLCAMIPAGVCSSQGGLTIRAPGMTEQQYASEPAVIDTQYVVDLAVKLGVDPLEVLGAYRLAVRHGVGVEAVIYLRARGTVDWTHVEESLARLGQVRKALGALAQGSSARLDRLVAAASGAYGASARDLSLLCRAGLSEDEILTLLFLLNAPRPIESRDDAGYALSGMGAELGRASIPDMRKQLSQMCEALRLRGLPREGKSPGDSGASRADGPRYPKDATGISPIAPERIVSRADGEEEGGGDEGEERGVSSVSIVDPSSAYNSERVSPFKDYFSGLSETMDPSSGSLILRQRDLVLPGRNGLDLVLERVYVSQTA